MKHIFFFNFEINKKTILKLIKTQTHFQYLKTQQIKYISFIIIKPINSKLQTNITYKLYIFYYLRQTVELCRQLEKAGVSFIAIHGRTALQHTGNVNFETLKLATESVSCPVIANGDVKTLDDCEELQRKTNCKGNLICKINMLHSLFLFCRSDGC